ncbi:MAG: translation initiation factor IF-3 [Defluviitaleaceae bacterium]|nr:translation initiation factor IF-3 [Defluviitaleaceae bacterium]
MINDEIRDKEVRLIAADGEQLGIVTGKEAQRLADEAQLDLVKIAPTGKPPVCKIMDYSKFRFEQAKKDKEARKKQKTTSLKEVRLSPNIDTHDLNVRIKQATTFLKAGDKVKVGIRFYGREMGRSGAAQGIMLNFAATLEEFSVIDRPPKMEGRNMTMILNPKAAPTKKKESKEAKKIEE